MNKSLSLIALSSIALFATFITIHPTHINEIINLSDSEVYLLSYDKKTELEAEPLFYEAGEVYIIAKSPKIAKNIDIQTRGELNIATKKGIELLPTKKDFTKIIIEEDLSVKVQLISESSLKTLPLSEPAETEEPTKEEEPTKIATPTKPEEPAKVEEPSKTEEQAKKEEPAPTEPEEPTKAEETEESAKPEEKSK